MLHYNPQHVSSSTMLNFRRTNCIITASCIVTHCKRPYSIPVESGLQFGPVVCVPGATHQAHTPQVQISRCQTPTTHTKYHK